MAYDERLADRIRAVLGPRKGVTERRMFGGLAFLLDGKMFCGVSGEELMVRVGPERHDEAMAKKNVRPMDFTGRPMKGYIFVEPAGCRTEKAVEPWVAWSSAVAATLEKGKKKKKARAKPR